MGRRGRSLAALFAFAVSVRRTRERALDQAFTLPLAAFGKVSHARFRGSNGIGWIFKRRQRGPLGAGAT
jgi:hypothetical protein